MGHEAEVEEGRVNQWQTRFGWRTDVVAASAYLLGPISGELNSSLDAHADADVCPVMLAALILLILETHSDYIRFHSQ